MARFFNGGTNGQVAVAMFFNGRTNGQVAVARCWKRTNKRMSDIVTKNRFEDLMKNLVKVSLKFF